MFFKRGNVLNIALGLLALLGIIIAGYFYWQDKDLDRVAPFSSMLNPSSNIPLTWEECIKYPASEITLPPPGFCRLPDGRSVAKPPSEEEKKKIQSPEKMLSGRCVPKFDIETGPELTASQEYANKCFEETSQETCNRVDIYSKVKKTFGDDDGISDCYWTPTAR